MISRIMSLKWYNTKTKRAIDNTEDFSTGHFDNNNLIGPTYREDGVGEDVLLGYIHYGLKVGNVVSCCD